MIHIVEYTVMQYSYCTEYIVQIIHHIVFNVKYMVCSNQSDVYNI